MSVVPGPPAVAGLLTELAVDQIRATARAGDLEAAVRALDTADAADHPAALDLLARVHAQRGEWAEADRCWSRVQAVSPAHSAAAAGRRTVDEILAHRRRPQPWWGPGRVAVATGLLVLLAAGGVVWWVPGSGDWSGIDAGVAQPADSAVADLGDDPAAQTRRAAELQRRLAEVEAERAASRADSAADGAALTDLQQRLAGPGVTIRRRTADLRLVFDDGLFSSADRLADGAGTTLGRVGRALRGTEAMVTVVGHVVAVPGGRIRGGSWVALARAQVVAARLAAESGLPLTSFTLRSADQTDGPHPWAARNRTVTLLIAAAGSPAPARRPSSGR